nr:DAK2 domain-containing protein [Sporohalobacter salinus]
MLDVIQLKAALKFSVNYFADFQDEINKLNVFPVPDGDTGTNMYLTLSKAVEKIEELQTNSISELLEVFANGALMGARGNSGVIFSQLLRGFSEKITAKKEIGVREIAAGLKNASAVAYQGVMKPIEGTILTVAKETGETAISLAKEKKDIIEFLELIVKQAESTVEKTPELLSPLKEAGVVDAGGKGYKVFLEGIYRYFILDDAGRNKTLKDKVTSIDLKSGADSQAQNLEYKYCTEFIIKDSELSSKELRRKIDEYGDSLLVVEGNGFIKVHIHSNNPGLILEVGLEAGNLTEIKIDNMEEEQHENRVVDEESKKENEMKVNEVNEDRIGVIAVAAGDGIIDMFESLGVDLVIEGGQSMNPSTEDLLEATKEIKADQVIILPNNKNIISAAKQVIKIADKEVEIIETKSVPQGIAAMMMFSPAGQLTEIKEVMEEEVTEVKTGEVTYAVCDSDLNGLNIEEGDILGLVEGDIEVVTKDRIETVWEILDSLVEEDDYLITIYVGEEVDDKEVKQLEERLENELMELDLEICDGGQPLYYYLIAVE